VSAEVLPVSVASAPARATRSPGGLAWRRFRRNWLAVLGLLVLLALLVVCFGLPLTGRLDPTTVDLGATRQAPGSGHLLGTDAQGRDVFARLVYAGRVSMGVGLAAAFLAIAVGSFVGAVSGAFGGWVDALLMRVADVFLSFPPTVVVVVVAGILGPSAWMLILALGAFTWPISARVVRGVVLSLREREYIQASRAVGAGPWWVIRKHLLPASLSQVVVVFTIGVATCILQEAGLSFLGLGVQPPTPSWGGMLRDAQSLTVISSMPWLWIPPGVAVAVTVLAVNFVGDGLRDAVDPRQR
jgi:ABC-type dipeptide/oligopeptide/nickel transport system permease subunit